MFAQVPIIGTGAARDPYRPDLLGVVDSYQCNIQSGPDGRPLHSDCLVLVPDWKPTAKLAKFSISPQAADALLAAREPRLKMSDFKEVPVGIDMRAVVFYQLTSDNFNRADNTDLGASWDAGYTTRMDLVSNRIRVSATVTQESDETNTFALPVNQWAQCTISTWTANTDIRYAWLMVRAAAPATMTWYQATIARNDGSFTTQLSKKIAGVETAISSENSTSWTAGDILRVGVYDSALTLFRNGTTLLTGTDSAITSAGRAGVGAYVAVATPATVEFDDFIGGGYGPMASMGRGICRGNR